MRHFEILDFFSRPDLILNLYLHTHTLFLSHSTHIQLFTPRKQFIPSSLEVLSHLLVFQRMTVLFKQIILVKLFIYPGIHLVYRLQCGLHDSQYTDGSVLTI